ncbi:hypothetical protein ACFW2X_06825 [Streptomyces antibioticus]|uniref:hypothetical protein n=1 Tax=Streptomyces antibioticus TaxID=1890 RepID=UPI00367CCD9C
MAFPQDPLGLRGYVLVGGEWVRVSPAPHTRDPITHKRGRPYRANASDPTEATALFPNRDGIWSPRNAEGPYYGRLPRNTPFKAVIPGGDAVHLELTGGTDRASTPSATALNVAGNLDARIDLRLNNWSIAGEVELWGKYQLTGDQRSWQMSISTSGALGLRASLNGLAVAMYSSTVPIPVPPSGRVTLRVTRDNATGTATFYTGSSVAGPWTQLGSQVAMPTGAIYASTAPLSVGDIDTLAATPASGSVYAVQLRDGIDGTVVADADFTAQTSGATSFTDGVGLTWTLNANATLTDDFTRFELEVPEWPAEWTTSEADAWTSVAAAGILRRLGQGQKPLDSTLRRRIPSGGPIAYWPCEDGQTATQFYSPVAGVQPLATSGMELAAEDSLAGSSALPTIQGGATVSGTVPAPAATPTQWHTEFVYKIPNNGPATARTVIQWLSTGTVRRWRLMLKTLGAEIYGYDADDVQVTAANLDLSGYPLMFGSWTRWKLFATESGGTVTWTVAWVVVGVSGASSSTSYSGTVGRISGIKGPDGGYSSDLDGLAFGHFTVLGTANSLLLNSADTGFNGETVGARVQRLCREEGVPVTVVGTVADTQQVGPQRPAALLDLLREAAAVDGGIFGESRRGRGLLYRTRASLYNQAPVLTLDYAAKEIAPPFRPVEDDQVRNEWTVEREGGSSAVASLATGPLSIADIGHYPDSTTLSLFSDAQTDQVAGWLLHLSTWDEARWPSVTLRLHRHPEFIPNVLTLDVGDKIRIENVPKRFAGGGAVELLVDSWEETLRPRAWEITFNCAPAGPWDVAELAVVEDFEDTAYEVPWTDGGNAGWVRSSAQAHTGSWSLKSGAISNNQTSDAIISVPLGKTEMRFWYWTSSEAAGTGFEGDRLLVLVDGVQVLRAQGTTPWTQAIVDVTGASTVTLRYAKDNSTAVGSDSAHIDNVSFTGRGGHRANTAGSVLLEAITTTGTDLVVATPDGPQWTTAPVQLPTDMTMSGETLRVPAISSWALDAFGRSVSGGWGSADSGQTWFVVGGTVGTDYAVGSGYGQHILTTVSASRRSGMDFMYPDVDVYVSLTTSATATGGSLYGGPIIRYVDADNLYMLRVEFTTANAINLDVRKRVAAAESSIGAASTSLTHVAGTFVRTRFQVFGSLIRAKAWAVSAPEPPEWHVIVTDTSITTSNYVGARSIAAAGNTNVNPQVRFDNYEVVNPQRMSGVVRSLNGVVKPHGAGAHIGLAQPAYPPL